MSARPAVGRFRRVSEIAQVAARHGFGYLFERHRIGDFMSRHHQEVEPAVDGSSRGQRLRTMLDELGPTFVKFGQLLSTRPDVVPPDIVLELRGLQDAVRPFSFADVERTITAELELSIEQLFLEFEETPAAAASIGQVHRAVLPNGDRVIVKVQRPDAPRLIEADLQLMYQVARRIGDRVRALAFVDTVALVDDFARTIRQELDYRMEGRNAEKFHRNFAGQRNIVVPRVYWGYSGRRVLTLERLEGAQLRDVELGEHELGARRRLAYEIAEAWMAMIFRHGFFHGDPHPSNVIVLDDGRVGLIDFGMVGRLSDEDMTKLTRLFIDAVNENVEKLPRRLAELGVEYPKEKEAEFVTEIRDAYYRYYGASLREIDPIQLIREAFGIIYRMHLRLPTRFMLLDRAIATLGSVGTELYPEFNVFDVARPYARELLLDRYRPRRLARVAREEAANYWQFGRDFPYQFHDTMEQIRDGQVEVGFRHENLDPVLQRMDVVTNRLVVALVATGMGIASALIGIFAEQGPRIFGLNTISIGGFVAATALGLWLVVGVIRSGRI